MSSKVCPCKGQASRARKAFCWLNIPILIALAGCVILTASCRQLRKGEPARSFSVCLTESPEPISERERQRRRQNLPAALEVLAGDPTQARRVAVLIHTGDAAAMRSSPSPYNAILGFRVADSIADPELEGLRLREALDVISNNGRVFLDAWAEGLAGLILRYAVERARPGRPPIRYVVLVDTPNRGLSPSGWPTWEAQPIAVPAYAVSGSTFLNDLNGPSISDLTTVDYVTIWRGSRKPAIRSSVMRLPRRGMQFVLPEIDGVVTIRCLLNAPVLVARINPGDEAPIRPPSGEATKLEEEARRMAPRAAGNSPSRVKAFLENNVPASLRHAGHSWVRFGRTDQPGIGQIKQWQGSDGGDLLAGITNPVTVSYLPASNEVVITGYEDFARDPLRVDTLASAVRAFRNGYPAVSIDPPPASEEGPEHHVRYEGETAGTWLGGTMFEADRVMKVLALGKCNLSGAEMRSRISGHVSIASSDQMGRGVWRLWFEPARWHAREQDPFSATIDAAVKCNWEKMTSSYVPSQPVVEFTDRMTREYARYAVEQPSFDALDQAAVLVAMAKWIVEANLDLLMEPGEFSTPFRTPQRCPVIRVNTNTHSTRYKSFLIGGVTLGPNLRHVTDTSSQSMELTRSAIAGRPKSFDKWEFQSSNTIMHAVALKGRVRDTQFSAGIQNAADRLGDPVDCSGKYILNGMGSPPRGNFIINNETGAPMQVDLWGPVRQKLMVPSGRKSSVSLEPGIYQLRIEAECGSEVKSVTIRKNVISNLSYRCRARAY